MWKKFTIVCYEFNSTFFHLSDKVPTPPDFNKRVHVPLLLISRDILLFCNILFLDSWSEEDCEELQQSRSRFDGIRGEFLVFAFFF